MTLDLIQNDDEIISLIAMAENQLKAIGYTEHGARHLGIVTCRTDEILSQLGFDKKQILLAKISAWLHDVGNAVGSYGIQPAYKKRNVFQRCNRRYVCNRQPRRTNWQGNQHNFGNGYSGR